MSLILSRLENAYQSGDKTIARCPACAETGKDRQGKHLFVLPGGKFGCVAFPGDAGKVHRRRIYALVGEPAGASGQNSSSKSRGSGKKINSCVIRVKCPPAAEVPDFVGSVFRRGTLGCLSSTLASKEEGFSNEYLKDPMAANAFANQLDTEDEPSQASRVVPDIDRETGYPIIDGAICPF